MGSLGGISSPMGDNSRPAGSTSTRSIGGDASQFPHGGKRLRQGGSGPVHRADVEMGSLGGISSPMGDNPRAAGPATTATRSATPFHITTSRAGPRPVSIGPTATMTAMAAEPTTPTRRQDGRLHIGKCECVVGEFARGSRGGAAHPARPTADCAGRGGWPPWAGWSPWARSPCHPPGNGAAD